VIPVPRITRIALVALALLLLGATAASARTPSTRQISQADMARWYIAVDARGNDGLCQIQTSDYQVQPNSRCRTIAGAIARAKTTLRNVLRTPMTNWPTILTINLQPGVYRENVQADIGTDVRLIGRGAGTKIVGNVWFSMPYCEIGGNIPCAVSGVHSAFLDDLVVDGNVSTSYARVGFRNVSINGAVSIGGARSDMASYIINSSITATPASGGGARGCAPAVSAPQWQPANGQRSGAVLLRIDNSTLSGSVALEAITGTSVAISHSILIVDGTGCPQAMGVSARFGPYVSLDTVLIRLVTATCGVGCGNGDPRNARAGISAGEASLVRASAVTIGGPFDKGVEAWRGGATALLGVAIDGAGVSVDTRGVNNLDRGTLIDQSFVHGTGPMYACAINAAQCPELASLVTARGTERLVRTPLGLSADWGYYPGLASPVVDTYLDGSAFVGAPRDLADQPRPVPAIAGNPARYDVGAWERTTGQPADNPRGAAPILGPIWMHIDLTPIGVIGGAVAGAGVPVLPGVAAVEAGTEAAASTPSNASAATAAPTGPVLLVDIPARVTQGSTATVRVKAPYQGRLTVRLYGANGGLINVGRGHKVNRGWRTVAVRIGPHARLGTLRAYATLSRPTRAQLAAVDLSRIVKRGRR
jgi:hypothetical protein